jgi:hypothetical protein
VNKVDIKQLEQRFGGARLLLIPLAILQSLRKLISFAGRQKLEPQVGLISDKVDFGET